MCDTIPHSFSFVVRDVNECRALFARVRRHKKFTKIFRKGVDKQPKMWYNVYTKEREVLEMKKVYCIIFDFEYEERVKEIYENEKDAIKRLIICANAYGYDNIVDYMREEDISLVEWECDSNKRRRIKPSYDW